MLWVTTAYILASTIMLPIYGKLGDLVGRNHGFCFLLVDCDHREQYRELIDALVRACREGQGQIGRRRVRHGVWNSNATTTADELTDRHGMNATRRDECNLADDRRLA